ncbi:MAG: membrane protein insertion efficiency factor YidD [Melioribacteraceae bacterium]|jgi:putative component of membrane protein insertase Oxa1/YidC/SpoIIIJ protein YidD|nr:membrane protein insertion efficiency factor YidD [Melioribacteraceae bacterium]
MKIVVFILLISPIFISAQTDWYRWGKANINYSSQQNLANEVPKKNVSALSVLKDGYSFFISDLDGDNCPFYPTCSSFYIESISETNIFKATLMFADRFTRDSNLFKTHEHYPKHISGRLYDPIGNYLLTDSIVVYYSREEFIK